MQRRQFLRTAGAVGAAAAATAPASAQEDDDAEDDAADDEEQAVAGGTETVIVGPDGDFSYDPSPLEIPPGTTVVFEWDSPNHNVNPTEQPEDADWEGRPEIVDDPYTYEDTFPGEGEYEYVCDPHVAGGMIGEIVVDPDAGQPADVGPTMPAAAMSIGIGVGAALTSTIALTLFFLKYGGRREE